MIKNFVAAAALSVACFGANAQYCEEEKAANEKAQAALFACDGNCAIEIADANAAQRAYLKCVQYQRKVATTNSYTQATVPSDLTKAATLNLLDYQEGKNLRTGGMVLGVVAIGLTSAAANPKHYEDEANTLRALSAVTSLTSVALIMAGNVQMERAINKNMKIVLKLTTL